MEFIRSEFLNTNLLRKKYIENNPFPHIVLDNFIDTNILDKVEQEFPNLELINNRITFNDQKQIKFSSKGSSDFSPNAKELIFYLNSDLFLKYLQDLTGIKETLISDPYFTGAGYHEIKKGGLLKVHADFNKHGMINLDRRLNLLIYLNKSWDPSWGGNLELYDKNDLNNPVVSIEPFFNRCVIFSTTSETYHGHPNKLNCPENRSRKSIALYYFSSGRQKSESGITHGTKFVETKGEKFKFEYKFNLKGFIAEWFLSSGMKKLLNKYFGKNFN